MGLPAPSTVQGGVVPFDRLRQLGRAREVLTAEADAVARFAAQLPGSFLDAVDLLDERPGGVVVTGMGKAGLVGRKIAATLASLGVTASVLHPGEAVHGDLGAVRDDATVLALSHSGETGEVTQILGPLARREIPVVAVTARGGSTLGRAAAVVIPTGRLREADAFDLAPTVSTAVMLAVGDALAVVLAERRGFTPDRFAAFHPAGSLGRKLCTVGEVMRTGEELRTAPEHESVRAVFAPHPRRHRRTGAVMLTDADGRLTGLFTDSDLARLLEHREEAKLDGPVSAVMTRGPLTVTADQTLGEVVALLSRRKVSEIPVVAADGRPAGLIDITDLIGLH